MAKDGKQKRAKLDAGVARAKGAEQLKKLQGWLTSVHGATLASGWEARTWTPASQADLPEAQKQPRTIYITPNGQRLRSRLEVARYLGLSEGKRTDHDAGSQEATPAKRKRPDGESGKTERRGEKEDLRDEKEDMDEEEGGTLHERAARKAHLIQKRLRVKAAAYEKELMREMQEYLASPPTSAAAGGPTAGTAANDGGNSAEEFLLVLDDSHAPGASAEELGVPEYLREEGDDENAQREEAEREAAEREVIEREEADREAQQEAALLAKRLGGAEDEAMQGADAALPAPVPLPVGEALSEMDPASATAVIEAWEFLGRFFHLLGLQDAGLGRPPTLDELAAALSEPENTSHAQLLDALHGSLLGALSAQAQAQALPALARMLYTVAVPPTDKVGLAPEHELRAVAALSQGGLPSSPRCWPELARRYLLLVAAGSVASKEVEALGLIVRKFPGAPAKQLLVGSTVADLDCRLVLQHLCAGEVVPQPVGGPRSAIAPDARQLREAELLGPLWPYGKSAEAVEAHKARLDATSLAAAEAVLEAEGHVASGPGESPVKNKQVKLPRKAEMEEVMSSCRWALQSILAWGSGRRASSTLELLIHHGLAGAVAAGVGCPLSLRLLCQRLDEGSYGRDPAQIRAALSADLAALARTWRAAVQSGCGAFTLPGVSASHVLAVAEKVEATADALGSGTGIMEEGEAEDKWPTKGCAYCRKDYDNVRLLLCDSCDSEWHTYCLEPPLMEIPQTQWFCPTCQQQHGRPAPSGPTLSLSESYSSLTEEAWELAHALRVTEYSQLTTAQRAQLLRTLCNLSAGSEQLRDYMAECNLEHRALHKDKFRPLRKEILELERLLNPRARGRPRVDAAQAGGAAGGAATVEGDAAEGADAEEEGVPGSEEDGVAAASEAPGTEQPAAADGDASEPGAADGGDGDESPAAILRVRLEERREQLRDVTQQMQAVAVRRQPAGQDRRWGRYWALGSSMSEHAGWDGAAGACLFVEALEDDDRTAAAEDGAPVAAWQCYPSADAADELADALNPKGRREGALRHSLQAQVPPPPQTATIMHATSDGPSWFRS